MTLLGAGRVRELLRRHDIMLTKSLGQNFVIDPNTIRKVVELAGVEDDDHVLEIGAGAGSLTLALSERAASVTAIEIDERLRPVLEETVGDVPNVDLRYADVLALDVAAIGATKVVANLPYNIAAQTVIKILQEAPGVGTVCVMTQKEVGERLAAGPGSKTYGLSSVLVGFYGSASIASTISRNVFFPVPTVDSVLVRIARHDQVDGELAGLYADVVRAAFAQRRKNVRNSLATFRPAEQVESALSQAGIDASARAETLAVSDFIRLARAFG